MTRRADIVQEARGWLGTPYHHQARVKGVGVDCGGLVIGIGRALGLCPADFDIGGYSRQPDGTSLMAHCSIWMRQIELAAMAPGDVVVMRFERDPNHLAVLGDYRHGGLSVIHALGTRDGKGRVVEHRLDPASPHRLVAAFRLAEVA